MAENAYPYDTAVVRQLLKNKRKTRGIRSCFPCRHRKVRCDGREPCSNCVKRGHSELCRVPTASGSEARAPQPAPRHIQGPSELHLEALNNTIEEAQSQSSTDPSLLISKLEKIEDQIASLKADLRAAVTASSQSPRPGSEARTTGQSRTRPASKSPGRYFVEDATGATIYLGSHSDTPLALGCRRASAAGDMMLHDALIDQFVPRTYPFTNLWGSEATAKNVCETLPDDSDIIRYWQVYQSIVYPFYPSLVTIDQFGPALFTFLDERAAPQEATAEELGPDSSWLALLFAVLACGVQFSDDPIKERDLRSKVLICSSFQCLRMSNFFNHTNLDQIQAMSLIGHCLRNNLDTNSAWILMGSTIRLAQSIGLHEASPALPECEQFHRNRLWWTLVWQDTFLSFTYDRPPSTITMSCPIPYRQHADGLSFQECVFTICNILLNKARQETAGHLEDPQQSALKYKQQLEELWDDAAPLLTDKTRCISVQDHLERLALGVHLGYGICRLSRVYLSEVEPHSPLAHAAAMECTHRAMQAIESFLDLHRFSASVCRSWAFVHNAVSCAITLKGLATLPVEEKSPELLVRRLIAVLEKEEKDSEWCDADTNVRYFGPYSRALKALREIYRDGA
ncbi:fungal-specific transcription factor domain-containing protein [Aspergillus bertholletiae]|uniref:Fungal-specific transcription factor domain-containing protein n=1 Tax=Aspergillus bertholletiae TaxID=1226010 RepID=A0A5N7ANY1_9EURO|nr:fungal-specific transcription factor domain-containing protein [Aspergillus bertholletiae]